ncbi:MAG: hypothetical protein GEU86_11955 [Actinophytocola sp.]|nr:hypothetical protein [Actinophytocola sp.]
MLAVVHAAAYVAAAKLTIFRAIDQTVAIWVVIALLIGVALAWSSVDGWLRRPDRVRNWVLGALVAGPLAAVLYVTGRAIFVDQTGVADLGVQLTSGAAFTALLVLVPAGLGLFVGSRLEPPSDPAAKQPAAEAETAEPATAPARRRPAKPLSRPAGKAGRAPKQRPASKP